MSECRFKRYKRYIKYTLQWLFTERLRGLDFTMRDTHLVAESNGLLHGYSKTDESHAKAIFDVLGANASMNLLDIGCGKGAFLREAAKYNFGKIAGLEYVEALANIAKENFVRLHLEDRIDIFCGDAVNFKSYQDYNVFYFFNPFDKAIMDKVVKAITKEQKSKIWIILHNPVCADVVTKYGGKEIKRLFDNIKSYQTIIYEIN